MRNLALIVCLFFIAIVQLNAQCACLETSEILANQLVLCEDFESYLNGSNFPSNNPKWSFWPGATSFAQIQTPNSSSKALYIRENGSGKPDLLLKLGNKTTGRYRLSWRMFIPKGKTAKYNVQHRESGNHWAFSVAFGANGIGSAEMLRNTVSQFPYLVGAWNKVMHIVDLDEDLVELWINDEFVDAWKFSLGNTTPTNQVDLKQLGSVNFFTENATSEYYVDNICMWTKYPGDIGRIIQEPICLKNGKTSVSELYANAYELYTKPEFSTEPCRDVCDFGGLNINNAENNDFNTRYQITKKSLLPNQILTLDCVKEAFPLASRKQLRGVVRSYVASSEKIYVTIEITESIDYKDFFIVLYDCDNHFCSAKPADESTFEVVAGNEYKIIVMSIKEVEFSLDIRIFPCPGDCLVDIGACFYAEELAANTTMANMKLPEEPIFFTKARLFDVLQNDYLGHERAFRFFLEKEALVNIQLTSSSLGYCLFLTGNLCSYDLLAFSETKSNGGTANISMRLKPGIYHILIDQLYLKPEHIFSLEFMVSDPESALKPPIESCPVLEEDPHIVKVRANPLLLDGEPLTLNDRIYIFNQSNINNREVDGLNWNGQEIQFTLNADSQTDTKDCGYSDGESIEFKIIRNNKIYYVRPVFQVENGSEVTASNRFKRSGKSLITGFYSGFNYDDFGVGNLPSVSSSAKQFFVEVNHQKGWRFERFNNRSPAWINVNPSVGFGFTDVNFEISANINTRTRTDTLLLINEEGFYKTIIINQPGCTGPSVTADPDQTVCANQLINLTATGVGTISWRTPTGNIVSGTRLSTTVTTTQTFTAIGTLNGCTATDEVKITVSSGLNANAGLDQTICPGSSTTLSASGGTTYRWSSGQSGAQIPVNPTQTTTYTVTVTQNGCEATDQVVVNVVRTVADAGPAKSVCAGSKVTLQATGGGTYLWNTNETTASINVTPGTSTTYRVVVTNNGCSAEATVLVTVIPLPLASAGPSQTTCAGEPVTLTASGGGTYLWSDKNATTAQIKVAPTTNTNYVVSVTQGGCTKTASVLVRVNPKPIANAGLDKNVCQGEFTTLSATGGGTYNWSTGATSAIVNVRPSSTQTYGLTVTTNGCTDTDSITVFIRPKPVVTLAESRLIFGPTGFLKMNVSSGTPGYRYQWFRNDTLISTQKDLFGLRTGIYKLIVTDAIGCSVTFGPQAIVTTSTVDPTLNRNIQIFPNPSIALIHIQFDLEQATQLEISILDGLGKNIWHQNQRNFFREKLEVDLSNHPAGMYWVQFKTENGAFYKKIMRL